MLQPPSLQHLFGTDQYGGDIFSRVIYGAQLSLPIGFIVVISAVLIGSSIGAISGYFGGAIDEFVMRITDIFLSFPMLILAMVVSRGAGPKPREHCVGAGYNLVAGLCQAGARPGAFDP